MGISLGLSARILQFSTLVCLGLWSQQIFAAISIVLKPKTPAMGEDVLLFTGGVTGNISFFIWYRGDKINSSSQILFYNLATPSEQTFLPYTGRVRGFPNGSMEITGLNRNDSGSYTVQIQTTTQQEEATVTITVYGKISNVTITSNSTSAYLWAGEDSVRLTCTALGDEPRFSWSNNGTSLPRDPRYQISANNESLTISPLIRSDASIFTCTAFNSVSQNSSSLTLDMYRTPDGKIQCAHDTKEQVMLRCSWPGGSPAANVSLQILSINDTEQNEVTRNMPKQNIVFNHTLFCHGYHINQNDTCSQEVYYCNTFWCRHKEVVIVIGVLVGLAFIGLTVYLVRRSKKKTSHEVNTIRSQAAIPQPAEMMYAHVSKKFKNQKNPNSLPLEKREQEKNNYADLTLPVVQANIPESAYSEIKDF
uniref:Carcinoembryonic antigen-related cell adhesion molecule 5-like n=1 Tax=Geotrypetes seraphini TaxID=260995 RepID=A0A6P8SHH0_GEOSA|nr:carcinoembryonic antigen-related cell adhesion molecule 5-like [Geotrypetes seraphini]